MGRYGSYRSRKPFYESDQTFRAVLGDMLRDLGAMIGGLSRKVWVVVGVMILFVGGCSALVLPSYFEEETTVTTVLDKERVCSGDSDGGVTCQYLVFTEAGTFKVTDAIFGTVRFNSSDVYGRIQEDHTYKIVSYGWRLPFFSEYPNIKSIEEVES